MKSPCAVLMLIGIVNAAKALKSGEFQPDQSTVTLADVPKAMEDLPDVSVILESAESTMSGVSMQAARLQKEIETVQSKNTMRLQHEKKVFDQKLKAQEATNKEVAKQNAVIAKKVMKMNKTNSDLLKDASKLQKENADRRAELKLLKEQLEVSEGFLSEAYTSTDDSGAEVLEILKSGDEPPKASKSISLLSISEEISTEEAGSEEIPEAEPAAEPAAGKPDEQAESLVAKLQDGVMEMRKQGEQSEEKLKALFREHFVAGNERHKALLAQGSVLQSTLDSMKEYGERLLEANKHLTATQGKLDSQLHDASIFLKRLGAIAGKRPETGRQELDALNKRMHAAAAK